MKTATEVKVACNCCRKATATVMVKDNGFKTYPVCGGCFKCLYQPTVVRKLN